MMVATANEIARLQAIVGDLPEMGDGTPLTWALIGHDVLSPTMSGESTLLTVTAIRIMEYDVELTGVDNTHTERTVDFQFCYTPPVAAAEAAKTK